MELDIKKFVYGTNGGMPGLQLDEHSEKVALVTGGGRRIGAAIVSRLHTEGMKVILHSFRSFPEAECLGAELNGKRPDSAFVIRADLARSGGSERLATQARERWGRIDVLVNNAAVFYPTPVPKVSETTWHEIIDVNLKAPLFLSISLAESLKKARGCIVNIVDVHALRPLKGHTIYSIAKSGLNMLTLSLARELAPEVRCNAVSPGATLWPEKTLTQQDRKEILARVPLRRSGTAKDIADAVAFLVFSADYVTGQCLAIDGGRSLFQ